MTWRALLSWVSEARVRRRVSAQLHAGTLPRASGRTWIRLARGDHQCACCHRRIRRARRECESLDRAGLYAHPDCLKLWVEQSRASDDEPHVAI